MEPPRLKCVYCNNINIFFSCIYNKNCLGFLLGSKYLYPPEYISQHPHAQGGGLGRLMSHETRVLMNGISAPIEGSLKCPYKVRTQLDDAIYELESRGSHQTIFWCLHLACWLLEL